MFRKILPILIVLVLVAGLVSAASQGRNVTGTGWSQGDVVAFLTLLQDRVNSGFATYGNTHYHAAGSYTVDIGTTFYYVLNGVYYTKTASDTIADATAAAQATGTSCFYLFSVDADGDVTTTKGTNVSYLASTTAVYPDLPANNAAFAGLKVTILPSASESWTLGTDKFNLLGASQTVTFYNLSNVPALDITDF
jgi:hypothetical protein